MQSASCRTRSWSAEMVASPSSWTRLQMRRLIDARAYSRKSYPVVLVDGLEEEPELQVLEIVVGRAATLYWYSHTLISDRS
jgi:hypothetical protein